MSSSRFPGPQGWRLFVLIAALVIALAVAAFVLAGDAVQGSRAAIGVTARSSLLLFLAAFTASAFASLLPGPFSQWLLRERRSIGLSFAFSHLVHAVAITTFGVLNPAFWPGRPALANLPGSIGYLAIAALAISSHRGIARRMGPSAWRRLHVGGMWIIAAVFTYSYFKRVPGNFWYAVPSALIFTAVVVRWIGKRAQALKRARPQRRSSALID